MEAPLTAQCLMDELNKHVVGQEEAKKSFIIAHLFRRRRALLPKDLQKKVKSCNILIKGGTGTGKSALATIYAGSSNSIVFFTDATRYTKMGFVGQDVKTVVDSLVDVAFEIVKREKEVEIRAVVENSVKSKLLGILSKKITDIPMVVLEREFEKGAFDSHTIEIEVQDRSKGKTSFDLPEMQGVQISAMSFSDILGVGGVKTKKKTCKVKEAFQILFQDELDLNIDKDDISRQAIERAENGMVFMDEGDKIGHNPERSFNSGSEVAKEGVQNDMLTILEGTSITTKHGVCRTDNITFILAGTFNSGAVDKIFIPEFAARFPVRVCMEELSREDYYKILTDMEFSFIRQYQVLLGTEGLDLHFTDEAIRYVADFAYKLNVVGNNIGGRRLISLLDKLLQDVNYHGVSKYGKALTIDLEYVKLCFKDIDVSSESAKFIL